MAFNVTRRQCLSREFEAHIPMFKQPYIWILFGASLPWTAPDVSVTFYNDQHYVEIASERDLERQNLPPRFQNLIENWKLRSIKLKSIRMETHSHSDTHAHTRILLVQEFILVRNMVRQDFNSSQIRSNQSNERELLVKGADGSLRAGAAQLVLWEDRYLIHTISRD